MAALEPVRFSVVAAVSLTYSARRRVVYFSWALMALTSPLRADKVSFLKMNVEWNTIIFNMA
jgi:hypothetical protein